MTKLNGIKKQLVTHPDYLKRLDDLADKPNILISVTNRCNFKCVYCSTKNYQLRPANMDLELLRSIIKQCKDWNITPTFGATYEPFLHPEIDKVILTVLNEGINFHSNTNGSLLPKKIFDLPLNLTISINENESDFRYRNGKMNFEHYKNNLIEFINYRDRKNIHGHIRFQFADYEILESEKMVYNKHIGEPRKIASKMDNFAKYFGFDDIAIDDFLIQSINKRQPITVYNTGSCMVSFLATKIMPNTFEAFVKHLNDMPTCSEGYCDSCFIMLSIQADGGLAYCCADPTAKTIFHYLNKNEDLKSIWFGDKLNRIRNKFRSFKPVNGFCLKCLHPVDEHIKPLLTIYDKSLVTKLLNQFGVKSDLSWFSLSP